MDQVYFCFRGRHHFYNPLAVVAGRSGQNSNLFENLGHIYHTMRQSLCHKWWMHYHCVEGLWTLLQHHWEPGSLQWPRQLSELQHTINKIPNFNPCTTTTELQLFISVCSVFARLVANTTWIGAALWTACQNLNWHTLRHYLNTYHTPYRCQSQAAHCERVVFSYDCKELQRWAQTPVMTKLDSIFFKNYQLVPKRE